METIKEIIKKDPYLKVGNCMDVKDLNYAIDRINKLIEQFPSSSLLRNMYFKFESKRL